MGSAFTDNGIDVPAPWKISWSFVDINERAWTASMVVEIIWDPFPFRSEAGPDPRQMIADALSKGDDVAVREEYERFYSNHPPTSMKISEYECKEKKG